LSEIKVPPKPQYCSTLRSILQNDHYKDLTLKVGNQLLKVHSSFLAEQSLKFAALVEKQKNKFVKITDITFDQLKHLINFIYNGTIDNLGSKRYIEFEYHVWKFLGYCECSTDRENHLFIGSLF
jgi:hypothetical protein